MILVPRPPRPSRRLARAVAACALALVGHALMVGIFLVLSRLELHLPGERPTSKRSPNPVVLRGLTAQQWEENRGEVPSVKDERSVVANRRDQKKERPQEKPPTGQIVDVAPGNGEVDPNAKYIAETNNVATKESRARDQTAFYRNAMPRRTSPQPQTEEGSDQAEAGTEGGNEGLGLDARPPSTSRPKLAVEVPDVAARTEIAVRIDGAGPGAPLANRTESEAVKGNSDRLRLTPGAPEQGDDGSAGHRGKLGILNLLPSPSVLDKIAGAAANDHLGDVDEGDGTYLSTREWKYAGFFNRVKQSVGQHWNPQAQLHLRDPTMQIYGGRDRYTVLHVTLTEDGRLRGAYVEKSSGVDFLDVEAIKAFERAQPFPNPPSGLLAADHQVRFQFGFFLEMSGRPGLRLFRSSE